MPIHPQLAPFLATLPALDYRDFTLTQIREMAAAPLPPGAPAPVVSSTTERQISSPHGPRTVFIHRPLGDGPKPTVVFIHGGGWVVGSPDLLLGTTQRLSAYLGAVVVSISYRLAPEHLFPAGYEDALFLTRWAIEHVDELGGEAGQVAIAGESAGGNLAAAVALALRKGGALVGQLLLNPATDVSPTFPETPSFQADRDPALATRNVTWTVEQYLGAAYSSDWRASPLHAADVAGVAPAVIGISGYDPLHDQGQAYADKLTAAGIRAEVLDFDELVHAYAAQAPLFPVCNDALVTTCDRFRRLMRWPLPFAASA